MNIFSTKNEKYYLKINKLLLFFNILFSILYISKLYNNQSNNSLIYKTKNDLNFEYHKYQTDYITEKIKRYSVFQLKKNESYFINGIIRKLRPKKCLEIGVAHGGSSILILNAIKDINKSLLVSLDLYKKYYGSGSEDTGYRVKKFFPELSKNWQLYTGEQPHIFLEKLNIKFDFLFLDTAHIAPGELINIIEVLPFLNDNAIVVLHDIMFHLPTNKYYNKKEIKFHPSQIYLMSSLAGDKIIIRDQDKGAENIGAIFLYPNQDKYYLNYFLLLLSPWEYIPNEKQYEELKIFIKKYYKNEIYLHLFDKAYKENKIYVKKFKNLYKKLFIGNNSLIK